VLASSLFSDTRVCPGHLLSGTPCRSNFAFIALAVPVHREMVGCHSYLHGAHRIVALELALLPRSGDGMRACPSLVIRFSVTSAVTAFAPTWLVNLLVQCVVPSAGDRLPAMRANSLARLASGRSSSEVGLMTLPKSVS